MIQSNQKTSLLVPFQLPKFISEDPDYANFTLFLQAYYEWMEKEGNALDFAKSLLTYMDVDTTSQQFLDYYLNDFMTYFPKEVLADQTKVIKIARQLYQSKGTPASYKFLFRLLYNIDVDIFYTKDAVLKASGGSWYVARSLKLATSDPNFLSIENLRMFGEQSLSIATIETAIFDGLKTEVFISNIERLFQSGETVRVVDSNNQTVYFLNGEIVPVGTPGCESLRATIVGQISQVLVNPALRGLNYAAGDPVVVYGGLNPNTANPVGATVQVGTVTSGGVSGIGVQFEGYGYTQALYQPTIGAANTAISFSALGAGSQAPIAAVASLDPIGQQAVAFIPTDSIQLKRNYYIGNIIGSGGSVQAYSNGSHSFNTNEKYPFANNANANANTTLANAFTFTAFTTNPISSVAVFNQGGGLTVSPTITATSLYNTELPIGTGGVAGVTQYAQTDLSRLGILAPIQILDAGQGYSNSNTVIFIGGTGRGANAYITVNSQGSIINVNYSLFRTGANTPYPLGGTGYNAGVPDLWVNKRAVGTIVASITSNTVTGTSTTFTSQLSNGNYLITSSNVVLGVIQSIVSDTSLLLAANSSSSVTANTFYLNTAKLLIPGTLGTGASFIGIPNRIGEITTFNILDNGQDYISAPKISLKVQDLLVSNVNPLSFASPGDVVYQGANAAYASYTATVDSIFPIQTSALANNTVYQMRVYNYTSIPKQNTNGVVYPLKIDSKGAAMALYPNFIDATNEFITFEPSNPHFDSANGVITYGDGTANATATFLNGLVISSGQYLNDQGQPSGYDVLQSTEYNNYTYELTLEKEIAKYRDVLLNLLHPTGMQVFGRYKLKSANTHFFHAYDHLYAADTLAYYTNYTSSNATLKGSFANPSNNIIKFDALQGWNIANAITTNSVISMTTGNGFSITSEVSIVDYANNQVYLKDNTWVAYANVAYANAVSGTSNTAINILFPLQNTYNIVNNGVYTNPLLPLMDIIQAGDIVKVNGTSQMVTSVNYANNHVYLAGAIPMHPYYPSLVSVLRTFTSTNVQIYGPVGIPNYPYMTDELGNMLTTEDGTLILLG